ncbi:MAG: DEAD/DEAH box helicase [Bacteroidetes bacterium]|nr:MAG: DEAD/DEAH box helicase [Bacteroidota bacterium]
MENTISFSELDLSDEVLSAITEMGYENATPIQSGSIPVMMKGFDLIGQAETGTGKTAAFGLPILEMIDANNKNVQALILSPTRELCVQIAGELEKMSRYKKGMNVLSIYGGDSMQRQISGLKRGANIVAGTPGRIMDHLRRGTLKLHDLQIVVLDEADEMLNMGFREDIETILQDTPTDKQTVMFSATMSKPIMDISRNFLKNPELIKVMGNNVAASTIEQSFFETRGVKKGKIISNLVQLNDFNLSLVFCNTKAMVDKITDEMCQMGHKAEALHGDMNQNLRNKVMNRFRKAEINMLVATDVAARGLDINNVDAVFNYDLPHDEEYYVHRIGRTGRAGKAGKAYSFAESRRDDRKIIQLEKFIKSNIIKSNVPDAYEITQARIRRIEDQLMQIASDNNLKDYEKVLHDMYQKGFDPHLLAACLLKNRFDQDGIDLSIEKQPSIKPEIRKDRKREKYNGDSRFEEKTSQKTQKVKMHLALGRKDKVKPGDIVGALTGECKISGREIGVIDMFDHFSYFEISENQVRRVLKGMKKNTIKGKKVILSIARN